MEFLQLSALRVPSFLHFLSLLDILQSSFSATEKKNTTLNIRILEYFFKEKILAFSS